MWNERKRWKRRLSYVCTCRMLIKTASYPRNNPREMKGQRSLAGNRWCGHQKTCAGSVFVHCHAVEKWSSSSSSTPVRLIQYRIKDVSRRAKIHHLTLLYSLPLLYLVELDRIHLYLSLLLGRTFVRSSFDHYDQYYAVATDKRASDDSRSTTTREIISFSSLALRHLPLTTSWYVSVPRSKENCRRCDGIESRTINVSWIVIIKFVSRRSIRFFTCLLGNACPPCKFLPLLCCGMAIETTHRSESRVLPTVVAQV